MMKYLSKPKLYKFLSIAASGLVVIACQSVSLAGEADVIDAKATQARDGTWRIDATVSHADEGWDHYADNFEVLAPDGRVLGVRTLAHPHVNEQPFTRSLGRVEIPDDVSFVQIRARDSVHEYGGAVFKLELPR